MRHHLATMALLGGALTSGLAHAALVNDPVPDSAYIIKNGLAWAWAGSRLLDHFLFEVSSSDAATYAAAALLLAACAVLACYLPARRTLRIEPMTILREL